MSRRPKSTQSVALFPFLAVLVCTMGSLIFLLLVTTRMLADKASETVTDAAPSVPQLPVMSIGLPDPSLEPTTVAFPTAPDLDAKPDEPVTDIRAIAIEQRQRELDGLIAQWKGRADELASAREDRARVLALRQQLHKAGALRVGAMKKELLELETKLGGMAGELSATATGAGSAKERIELEAQLRELKRRLRAAQQTQDEDSKFEVVPFDIVSGTSRRPILIECTGGGMRFVPENVSIRRSDLAGFSHQVNPIIVGANALINYWTAYSLRQENPAREPEPYVLLLVRPSGTISYYKAMEMLGDLKQPHGYELLEEDTELQFPPLDPGAKAACESAVYRLITERNQVMERAGFGSLTRSAVGGGGGVLGGNVKGGGAGVAGGIAGATGPGTAGGGGKAGPSGGQRDGGILNGNSGGADQFELGDIISKDSWDRVENFEGPRRGGTATGQADAAKTGSAKGSQSAANGNGSANPNANAGSGQGGTGRSKETGGLTSPRSEEAGAGQGAGRSKGTLAAKGGSNAPSDGDASDGRADFQSVEKGADSATKSSSKGSSNTSGIESLDGSGDISENDGNTQNKPGTDPNFKLGPNAKLSLPVNDQRNKKKKAIEHEIAAKPEMLVNRHWGISEHGAAIGLEREVRIDVEPKRLVIGKKHAIAIEESDTRESTFSKIVTVLDMQARDWGKPPHGFFWKPRVRYVIGDGADANYAQIHPQLEQAGLSSTREFTDKNRVDVPDVPKTVTATPTPVVEPKPKPKRRFFRGLLR